MANPTVFPDSYWVEEYWPLEFWTVSSFINVVPDVHGCIDLMIG